MPKSERSIRTIPIGPQTRVLLEEHRKRFAAKWSGEGLLFPNQLGGPHRECNLLERVLRPAAKAAGLERVTWHQLRHIHASVLHDIGVPAKIAQQQLGHATVETTLNFYTHAIPDTHRRAIESLEEALFPVVPNVPKLWILEARVGFEPTNGGFADLSLGPLGYRAESLTIANLLELSGLPRAASLPTTPTFSPRPWKSLLRAKIAPILPEALD